MYIKWQVNYKPEVTAWMKWELPCKKMMNLHSSSIQLHMDGQAPSGKCQVRLKTIEDGIILKGSQIVVPHKKHEATLKLIYEGHLGLRKCKLRVKNTVYWPGLNDQLEKFILNFELCLKYSHAKCKPKPNTTLGQEIPVYPWSSLPLTFFILKELHIY